VRVREDWGYERPEWMTRWDAPPGFPAYCRIFHPVVLTPGTFPREEKSDSKARRVLSTWFQSQKMNMPLPEPDVATVWETGPSPVPAGADRVPWTKVCEMAGVTFSSDTTFWGLFNNDRWPDSLPHPGEAVLDEPDFSHLVGILFPEGTGECYVAYTESPDPDGPPRYVLDADSLLYTVDVEGCGYTPSYLWPKDGSWCLYCNTDACDTVVGGSPALIAKIVAETRLDSYTCSDPTDNGLALADTGDGENFKFSVPRSQKDRERTIRPYIDEMRAAGFRMDSVHDWRSLHLKSQDDVERAARITVAWIGRTDDPWTKPELVESLRDPRCANVAAEPLLSMMEDLPNPVTPEIGESGSTEQHDRRRIKHALATSLCTTAREEQFDRLVRLIRDERYGADRTYLVRAIARMNRREVGEVLLSLVDDEVLGHEAVAALAQLRIPESRSVLKRIAAENLPTAWDDSDRERRILAARRGIAAGLPPMDERPG
jgi:hypothetical protein